MKWKPSKSAKREFAIKMQNDLEFAIDYNNRKQIKNDKRKASSQFDYESAGGNYIPTKYQSDFCFNNPELFITLHEQEAKNNILYGYSCQEKVHHDYIHIVNEKIRLKNKFK